MITKDYKFILISFDNIDKYEKEKILDLFSSLFNAVPEINENNLIFNLYGESINTNYQLEEMVEVLRDDFEGKVRIFESNVFRNDSYKEKLIEIYNKNCINIYTNISRLCSYIFENSHEDVLCLKNIVLYSIFEDDDLNKVARAMFKTNLNVSKTASLVYMHRNTVINKLDIIEKRTGLNIQVFEEAVVMYLLMNMK